ncbi:5-carboxymethyl-2-hydroxymuconate Delta-isomerase [Pseudorhodoferax sp. Leaf267]|uniref:5-carboxymethyl-2-hydroxymuconate Delta-isomerase n=1 Tax=Pseudorhodoferax sp. Leaf267 TaxID=1736316 RepID=UPI0006FBCB9F|nr:5-carboxymethyl-2-hydroxymuconate Delta-isomerase [Pseudorhodoferax sp. Leaf267]KQP11876.1 5-carboxymethyl-2-hydroxymuconate isomerase [Pseudorhodoferax sp. Leaf267]
MPHLVVLYSPNLEAATDMRALCRQLSQAMLAQRDEAGRQLFPTGGTRVLAFAATHHVVADGQDDYAFVYLNLRMAKGRSSAVQQQAGEDLIAAVRRHFAPIFETQLLGVTLQIDEGHEVFDAKHSNLHPLFAKPA